MRLQLQGGKLYDYVLNPLAMGASYLRTDVIYGSAQYDFMLDVINYFSPYKEDRFFHLIPFVGVGVGSSIRRKSLVSRITATASVLRLTLVFS